MSKLTAAPEAFTFDDMVLAPGHSEVRSRKDPNTKVDMPTLKIDIPLISAPMNTITEFNMVKTMLERGGSAVLHRYLSIEDQVGIAAKVIGCFTTDGIGPNAELNGFFVAVGSNGDLEERVAALLEVGVTGFCVDVANGHSVHCIKAVETIKRIAPESRVMAGNVCTYEGTYNLAKAGADLIRVGVGPGSVCTTRLVTGHGVPQLTAIEECAKIKTEQNMGIIDKPVRTKWSTAFPDVVIIADGGVRSSGDAVKAIAIGADAVMIGGMLAGTSDTPGDTHKSPETGFLYKYYHGMASEAGRESWFDHSKTSFVPEGESTSVPYKGSTSVTIDQLVGGIKVGMSYAGAFSLAELREKAKWIRVSPAGLTEAKPHGKR
jgi:IMP dehydrogenase